MSMTVEDWFDKRDNLARAMNVALKDVPAEAVWFLSVDQAFSESEIRRARMIDETRARISGRTTMTPS